MNDAVSHKHSAVISLLRQHGGGSMNDGKCTPAEVAVFLSASASGETEQVERMLKAGLDVDVIDYDRRSALHLCAAEGQKAVMRVLLNHRADTTVRDRWGITPSDEARRHGHMEVAE
jgi:glutaminase